MVRRILELTGAGPRSRVLSLGCGIGDTELLLAPHVGEVIGIDLSPAAIRQARADAAALGIGNARFEEGTRAEGRFDAIIAIFFLHHLPDDELAALPLRLKRATYAGRRVLLARPEPPPALRRGRAPADSGADEALSDRGRTRTRPGSRPPNCFARTGWPTRVEMYDFGSSPLAGLSSPGWRRRVYRMRPLGWATRRCAAAVDLPRFPPNAASNFELVAMTYCTFRMTLPMCSPLSM